MKVISLLVTLLAFSSICFGADASGCMNCHDADEFAEMSSADIVADIKDPGIPPHKRFADMSNEELQAIAAELAGS
jgi:hypothetical protein